MDRCKLTTMRKRHKNILTFVHIYINIIEKGGEKMKSISQAAEEKKCSDQTIRNALDRGDLYGEKVGSQYVVKDNELYQQWTPRKYGGRRIPVNGSAGEF